MPCSTQATPWADMGDSLFATSLAGVELMRLRAWGTGDERHGDYVRQSPSPMVDIPQPMLEPILVDAAGRNGVILSFNTEYVSHEQDDAGVSVVLRDLRTRHEVTQRFRYVLAFDGAASRVASDLDLPFVGELARAGTVYAQFDADLTKYVAHRPSILHWIFNRAAGVGEIGMGLLRAVEPWTKWIAGWGFDAADGPGDLSDDTVLARIRAFIGDPDVEVSIVRTTTWYVNEQYATTYHSGRVFCGGDAVHRHPPSNGLGANTSIQDAFNLAWKIAFAVRGDAGPSLLESYSQERVPVGKQIVERANRSRREFAGLRDWYRSRCRRSRGRRIGPSAGSKPSGRAHCAIGCTKRCGSRTTSSTPTVSSPTSATSPARFSTIRRRWWSSGRAIRSCTHSPAHARVRNCRMHGSWGVTVGVCRRSTSWATASSRS